MRASCNPRRRLLAALAVSALATMSHAVWAAFPDKPIRVLVPFPAGSATDTSARILGAEISKATGQPVIVENKPGANGSIATEQVAKAVPDGYTILLTSNTHLANKFLFKHIRYDPIGDFKSIALYKKPSPLVLVVGESSPYRSLAEITAAAKSAPGKLTYGSGNSSSHVAGEMYKQLIGSDILYVPYKGNPEALSEVAAGRVDMMFADATSFLPLMSAGKLRVIMAAGTERLPLIPNVPTAAEAGLAALKIGSWGMFLAPARTPDAIADKLNALINAAVKTPAAARYFAATNSEGFAGTRKDLDNFMASESTKWGGIIRNANIQPE